MAIYITDGSVKIGAAVIPERKRPVLCVEKGNTLTVYGTFSDEERAIEFMQELIALTQAEKGEQNEHN